MDYVEEAIAASSQQDVCRSSQPPGLGIISRTVIASPSCKFILPVNIRSQHFNDIALVGENSVRLSEVSALGQLRRVAVKSDFTGRILAAKVFGYPRRVTNSIGSPIPKDRVASHDKRAVVANEGLDLPLEMLVFTLTSREMVFLWAQRSPTMTVTLCQSAVKLPHASNPFERLGIFLAVDPICRAVAVAAHEGQFVLYKTRSIQEWHKDVIVDPQCSPILDERIISIEGRVMHMSFLSPSTLRDRYHVVLLFILVHQGRTKMTCFDWDSRNDLSHAAARTVRLSVDLDDSEPTLLIPLSRTSDFVLVFDRHISIYRDLLSGAASHLKALIPPHILSPAHRDCSKRPSRWIAWDRTPHDPDFPKESFCIAREDGRIMYAECGLAGALDLAEAGDWPCSIQSSLACLSVNTPESSQSYTDILIANGDGGDGLVCKVGAWPSENSRNAQFPGINQFTCIEAISDWSPSADLAMMQPSMNAFSQRDRCTTLVANGMTPYGRISELRRGVRALVTDYNPGMAGASALGILDYGLEHHHDGSTQVMRIHIVFAITFPMETILIRATRSQANWHDDDFNLDAASWVKTQIPASNAARSDDVRRDQESLIICPWSDQYAIQITQDELRILTRPHLRQHDHHLFTTPVLAADAKPGIPYVAFCHRKDGVLALHLLHIYSNGNLSELCMPYPLDSDPTCIELFEVNKSYFIFVSTFGSRVLLLFVSSDGSMQSAIDIKLSGLVDDDPLPLVESTVLLVQGPQRVLLCATRNGYLFSSWLTLSAHSSEWTPWNVTRMGSTAIRIVQSPHTAAAALASCENDFCWISCTASKTTPLDIQSIWFDFYDNIEPTPSPVLLSQQYVRLADKLTLRQVLGGWIFVVVDDYLLFVRTRSITSRSFDYDTKELSTESEAIPCHILTGARPTNVIYVQSVHKLLVSTMEERARQPLQDHRSLISRLKLVGLRSKSNDDMQFMKKDVVSSSMDQVTVAHHQLKPAERVYSIIEWQYRNSKDRRNAAILIGTGLPNKSFPYSDTGRRLVFSVGKNGTQLQLQKETSYEHPVYCIALFSNDLIITSTGRTILMDQYDQTTGRLLNRIVHTLPSPGIYVTACAPFIYVSTQEHSHMRLELVSRLDNHSDFQVVQTITDGQERLCSRHLIIPIPSTYSNIVGADPIVLLTDKRGSSISGIRHGSNLTHKNTSEVLFEARLPRTVVRLQRGNLRPPWRRAAVFGVKNLSTTGVVVDDIVGACSDGTIYSFSIIDEATCDVLSFLQKVILAKRVQNLVLSSSISNIRKGDWPDAMFDEKETEPQRISSRDVDPRQIRPVQDVQSSRYIDGDLLQAWLNEDHDLKSFLRDGTDEDVLIVFEELIKKLTITTAVRTRRDQDSFRAIERWLAEIFQPVL